MDNEEFNGPFENLVPIVHLPDLEQGFDGNNGLNMQINENLVPIVHLPDLEQGFDGNNGLNMQINEANMPPHQVEVNEETIAGIVTLAVDRCDGLVSVVEKNLTATDLNPRQNRCSMPFGQVSPDFFNFLTPQELLQLDSEDPNVHNMRVLLLIANFLGDQPFLEQEELYYVNFRKLENLFALNGETWKGVRRDHNLAVGMVIQIWAFRVEADLGFVLTKKNG